MLPEAYVSFAGVLGDRLYAVHNSAAPTAFPFSRRGLARTCCDIVRFSATRLFACCRATLTEAETRGPGLTPLFPGLEDLALDVETPSGEIRRR